MLRANRVLETALYAENLQETAAFYEQVLGLSRRAEDPGRHVFFDLGATAGDHVLLLFNPKATQIADAGFPLPTHGASGAGHVCFTMGEDQVEAWARQLKAAGVEIEQDLTWPTTQARSLYFRDSAGNSVELGTSSIWF